VPTFLLAPRQVSLEGVVQIVGEDARHLARSLRASRGDTITVVCEPGREHLVQLSTVTAETVIGNVVSSRDVKREPAARLHVIQAIPKGQGMGEVCERLAEVGVASIWPVVTERTVPRLDQGQRSHRQNRWQRIAREAAQLAGRHVVPEVKGVRSLEEAVESILSAPDRPQLMACDSSGELALASVPWSPAEGTALVVGPEGGLGPEELKYLSARGAALVSLGPRNLRTILAATVAAVALLSRSGDMEAAGADR